MSLQKLLSTEKVSFFKRKYTLTIVNYKWDKPYAVATYSIDRELFNINKRYIDLFFYRIELKGREKTLEEFAEDFMYKYPFKYKTYFDFITNAEEYRKRRITINDLLKDSTVYNVYGKKDPWR